MHFNEWRKVMNKKVLFLYLQFNGTERNGTEGVFATNSSNRDVFKMGQPQTLFVYFSFFKYNFTEKLKASAGFELGLSG